MKFELWLIPLFIIASLLHGIAGMGFPLITIGALSGVYGLTTAIVLVLVPTAVLNFIAWVGGSGGVWHNATFYLKKYWSLVLVSILGSALGAYLLLVVNSAYLMLALAVVVLWYAVTSLMGKKITLPNTTTSLIVIGFVAGVVGGATNAMSSVLLMYLLSMTDDKDTIIKVGNLCYFVNKIVQAIVLKEVLLEVPVQTWTMIIGLTVLSVLGIVIGARLGKRLPSAKFRTLILWVLVGLGVKVGWQGVQGIL
ncbi:MAG: sulfite exporter TauE/SafE family protein [Moraxella sp.]|uniref:sulfite exporter TauE/SafE family protein n=1 Tax=Moraxella sp. TaxID=479 RepID=UPI0026DAD369|nr:sulfite exporter TauE/SafE family protein [Moraxella sp.]MDO4450171.1 sulfite exporter TauE/SafE family protein [Moraxella sp.]